MRETNFVRPMTLREIFRCAWVLYRRHFGTFLAITLVYLVLYYVLQGWISLGMPAGLQELLNLLIAPLLNFAYAATVAATSNAVLGRPVKTLDAYRRVLTPRIMLIMFAFSLPFHLVAYLYGRVFAASPISGLLDATILPVASVALHTLLLFRAPATVLEKRGLLDTFARVLRLFAENFNRKTITIGFVWKLAYFWLLLLLPTIIGTVTAVAYVLVTGVQLTDFPLWLVMNIPNALFELVVSPYGLLIAILLYYDIRARKEAYNELVLAEEMGYRPITEMITV